MGTSIKTICCILTVIILASCNENKDKNKSLPVVDIEANISNMEIVNLSRFTNNIQYVPLENIENLPFSGITNIDFSGNLILITNMNICLLYDSEGNFISKIGNKGRGPGEYSVVTNLEFGGGKNQKIYLSSTYDIFEYNIEGSFINKYTKSLLINDIYLLRPWHIIDDSLFFGYISNRTGKVEYKAMIINKQGDVRRNFKNYDLFNIGSGGNIAWDGPTQISYFKGEVFVKEQFNDTLFSLNDKYELIPRYIFNLGNLKMPLTDRVKRPIGEVMQSNIFIYDIFQTENYLLLNCNFGNRFPAKRLTPKPSIFPGGSPVWINTPYVLGLYYKQTQKLVFSKPSNTDNPLFTSGLYNDIDCGPRFFPTGMVNDSTLFMWVKADELKNHIASDDFKNSEAKYPEKKKELEQLADSLSVFDNPVLMFVTFKGK